MCCDGEGLKPNCFGLDSLYCIWVELLPSALDCFLCVVLMYRYACYQHIHSTKFTVALSLGLDLEGDDLEGDGRIYLSMDVVSSHNSQAILYKLVAGCTCMSLELINCSAIPHARLT